MKIRIKARLRACFFDTKKESGTSEYTRFTALAPMKRCFFYTLFSSVAENKEQCFFTGTHLNKKLWRRNKNGMVKGNIGKGED